MSLLAAHPSAPINGMSWIWIEGMDDDDDDDVQHLELERSADQLNLCCFPSNALQGRSFWPPGATVEGHSWPF
jgi:hypothetical protein